MDKVKIYSKIMNVLESVKGTQINLASEAARKILTEKIIIELNENND